MNDGRLLQAVLSLIEKYERDTISSISLNNEAALDVLQLSNLHKMETVLSAVSIGSNVDFLYEEKEAKLKAQEFVKEPRIVEKNFYEECVFEINPDKAATRVQDEVNQINESINSYLESSPYGKAYKKTDKKFREFAKGYNDLLEDIFENKSYDLEGCLNCRRPQDLEGGLPPFEITWEIKKFLDSLRSLLEDIKLSLDSTKLIADFCKFFKTAKNGVLCFSSYPMILAGFPIIINDLRTRLFEVGFSWTGLAGPLFMPVIKALSKAVEMLRGITLPVFDCLINGLETMSSAVRSIDSAISSQVNQGLRALDTGKTILSAVTFDLKREDLKNQMVVSEKVKQGLKFKEQEKVKQQNRDTPTDVVPTSESTAKPKAKYGLKTESEKFGKEEVNYKKGVYVSSGVRSEQERVMLLESVAMPWLDYFIDKLQKCRSIVDDFFNQIMYLVKSFQRLVIEPLYVSTKLIAEVRILGNLARIVNLVVKLFEKGFENICDDFQNESRNNFLKDLIESNYSDVELDFVKDENGDNFALVKSKSSDYKSRLRPNSCGEITIDINSNQNSLDLIYDHLANSLGTK